MTNQSSHTGLISWFARNPVAVNLLMLLFIAIGVYIVTNLKAETFPDVDPKLISISVAYPGATPSEVETAITTRVEETVLGIEGVERVTSSATEGLGSISVELRDFADSQIVKDDVEAAVDQIAQFPPVDAEQPSISIAEPGSVVMRLAVFGPRSEMELRKSAERLESALLLHDSISDVSLAGVRRYEISIEVPERQLRRYGLSLQDVSNAVDAESINISGGTLRTAGGEILLRTDAERRRGEDFSNVVVSSDTQGRELLLGDIATIVDGFEDGDLVNLFRGYPASFIDVAAADDQDAFDVSNAVKEVLNNHTLSPGTHIEIVSDNTVFIGERLSLLIRNGLMGLALVFLFLAMTLDLRLAFWTTVGIVVSFFGAFIFIGQFTTLNMISLFGLIVVLGIVVDDAIVIGENIYDSQQKSDSGVAGAIEGTHGVLAPVVVGVLTTVAAFGPLLFSTGTLGQILFSVPVVVISVLAMSLFDAFFLLPAHLAHSRDWSKGVMARMKSGGQALLAHVRDRFVLPMIEVSTKARYVTVACGLGLIIVASSMVSSGVVRFVFFPVVESDEVSVSLKMPEGTPFSQTEAVMMQIADAAELAAKDEAGSNMDSLSVTIGGQTVSDGFGPPGSSGGSILGSHLGEAKMTLISAGQRTLSSDEIERRWRNRVGEIAGVQSLTFTSSLIGTGPDISLDLSHDDDQMLFRAVESVATSLLTIPGVTEVETGLEDGKRQLEFELTPAGAAAGLTTQDVASQVRQAFFGDEVQRIQRDREEVRVYVRYPATERRSITDLDRFRVRLRDGSEVPLSVVATVKETVSPTAINHVDGRRVISIEADVDGTVTTPGAVTGILNDDVLSKLVARDSQLAWSYEGQTLEQQQDLLNLGKNFLIALGIMFLLLAGVLRSYVQPFVIIAAVPIGGVCAIFGHLLTGYDLSFFSVFGMVALSGVIVNDSVVMIDYYNKLRADKSLSAHDAVIAAAHRRFRPIMLTTLTTFLGLLPMLMETSLQAQFLIPMAISLGFGVLFAGILILALVPALLVIIEDFSKLEPGLGLSRYKRVRLGFDR